MSELIIAASRASNSSNACGLFFTVFRMSTCHTGAKRRFSRSLVGNPAEISARRDCSGRPMERRAVVIHKISLMS